MSDTDLTDLDLIDDDAEPLADDAGDEATAEADMSDTGPDLSATDLTDDGLAGVEFEVTS